jgi:hypothetical protein
MECGPRKVSEDAVFKLLVVRVYFSAELVGSNVRRRSNIARANADVVCIDEFP